MVAMPSQAVDDAWHEFILFTRHYERFCRNAFGRFLHHTPAEAMNSPTQASDGIKRAWRLACAHEGIDPQQAASPAPAVRDGCGAADRRRLHLSSRLPGRRPGWPMGTGFCASHIGCGGGCSGDSGSTDGDRGAVAAGAAATDAAYL